MTGFPDEEDLQECSIYLYHDGKVYRVVFYVMINSESWQQTYPKFMYMVVQSYIVNAPRSTMILEAGASSLTGTGFNGTRSQGGDAESDSSADPKPKNRRPIGHKGSKKHNNMDKRKQEGPNTVDRLTEAVESLVQEKSEKAAKEKEYEYRTVRARLNEQKMQAYTILLKTAGFSLAEGSENRMLVNNAMIYLFTRQADDDLSQLDGNGREKIQPCFY